MDGESRRKIEELEFRVRELEKNQGTFAVVCHQVANCIRVLKAEVFGEEYHWDDEG